VIYLTHARLMAESENSVQMHAAVGEGVEHRVCAQVVADKPRYALWLSRHDRSMTRVASLRERNRQVTDLRAVVVAQIHRTALVRYFREYRITGESREQTLSEYYRAWDPRRAIVAEHKAYLVSASTQYSALDLLDLADDRRGLDMLRRYEVVYGHFFSMFCDQARATDNNKIYLLESLIPEIRQNATRMRQRILAGELLPSRRFAAFERAGS
jgi:hypothetical protein